MSIPSVYLISLLITLQFFYCASTRSQQTHTLKYSERLSGSMDVLQSADSIPEQTIPDMVLKNARAIAIIPSVLKGAFIVGGRYGSGVMAVKLETGNWSYPSFISISGGSIGWQWGVESVDLVLVFKTEKSVDSLLNGQFTLGASAAVSAGPLGRHAEAATNTQMNAEVYSYARSKGLFLGASLEGTSLKIDNSANHDFYNSDSITAKDIFSNNVKNVPALATQFNQTIDKVVGSR